MERSRFNELSKSLQDEILTLIAKIASHPNVDSLTILKVAQEKIVEQFHDRHTMNTYKLRDENTYKLRAETYTDIDGFITYMEECRLVPMEDIVINKRELELTFTTNVSIDEIKRILKCFPDTHVMRETVALIDEYTGDRTYHD